ncbi:MAG TPA: hypothetical protein VKB05_21325 [Pyrinomonadaceae bacterium]|nr:hypothetical protein [Pyrinomonadaceae bacterium]
MASTAKEIVVQTSGGAIVARINIEAGVLHGHCEWYDGWGNRVACGVFKTGLPFTGIFLNWSRYLNDPASQDPYDANNYCKDWVTIFEAGFDSEPPHYERLIEVYCKGQRIQLS